MYFIEYTEADYILVDVSQRQKKWDANSLDQVSLAPAGGLLS